MRKLRKRFYIQLVIALFITLVGVPVGAGALSTYKLLYPACVEDRVTPGNFGLPFDDVRFPAQAGGTIRAYFMPGSNGATIIIIPTTNNGRGRRLHLANLYAQHGYSVLTYESRRCADMGPISLGYKEVSEVGDALAYLRTRPDVDPNRIGVTGFSSAGATAIMATARYPEIRAVIAEGGYGDFWDGVIGVDDDQVLTILYRWGIRLSYRAITRVSIDKLSPIDMIDQIAPRPILLIYGSEERSLPGARRQLVTAGDNAELWVIEGAGHGHYLDIAGDTYITRVLNFFDNSLRNSPS
jgi:dipeptidyl aminopeptidase/acylaminoacyl peptidase